MDNQVKEIKENIIKGAGELFFRYGIKSITMDDICRHLSISKKTIYLYFEDKDALIYSFIESFIEHQKNLMNGIREKSKNVIEELILISDYMRSNICNINPALLNDLRKYHNKSMEQFYDFKKTYMVQHMIQSIEDGIKQGYFRKEIDSKIITKMRVEQMEFAFNPEIFPDQEYDISKVHMELFDHFFYGICTLKGHKALNKIKQITEEE